MREHHEGGFEDMRLAYVGVQNNVSNSLAIICHKLGIQLTLATPEQDDNGESLDDLVELACESAGRNLSSEEWPTREAAEGCFPGLPK